MNNFSIPYLSREHIEKKNLVYSPENAREMVIRHGFCRRSSGTSMPLRRNPLVVVNPETTF